MVVQSKPVKIHSKENLMQQKVGELEIVNFPRRGKRMKVKAMKGQSEVLGDLCLSRAQFTHSLLSKRHHEFPVSPRAQLPFRAGTPPGPGLI